MAYDPTESIRRDMLTSGQPHHDLAQAKERWDHNEVREVFEITGFLAPFAMATRKADGKRGTLEFTHSPRFYFNFIPD